MVLDNLCSNSGIQLYSVAFVENSGQYGLCVCFSVQVPGFLSTSEKILNYQNT